MTFGELKEYVVEALGEEVLGVDQIIAGVRSGFGDLIARGYREFKHTFMFEESAPKTMYDEIMTIRKEEPKLVTFKKNGNNLVTFKFPADCLAILYIKIFFTSTSGIATKLALNNPAIDAKKISGVYRTDFNAFDFNESPSIIYYKKEKDIFVEWNRNMINGDVEKIEIGYYKSLPFISESVLRKQLNISFNEPLDIHDIEIPLAEDYCNVLINFMVWYTAQSNGREQEQLTVLKNEYKYSVEDLLARKNREDQYDDTVAFVKLEG